MINLGGVTSNDLSQSISQTPPQISSRNLHKEVEELYSDYLIDVPAPEIYVEDIDSHRNVNLKKNRHAPSKATDRDAQFGASLLVPESDTKLSAVENLSNGSNEHGDENSKKGIVSNIVPEQDRYGDEVEYPESSRRRSSQQPKIHHTAYRVLYFFAVFGIIAICTAFALRYRRNASNLAS